MENTGTPTISSAPKIGRFSASFAILRQSWEVLKLDRELVFFPIWSAIASIFFAIVYAIGYLFLFGFDFTSANYSPPYAAYLYLFSYYITTYFVLVFFQAGLVASALLRFSGGDPTLRYGLAKAWSRKGAILGYAVIAATVGLMLRYIADRVNWIGRMVTLILGLAWSILTVFIAPVLVMTDLGPIEAIKQSGRVFKQTWGENAIGRIGLGLAMFFLFLASLVPAIVGLILTSSSYKAGPVLMGFGLTLLLWLVLSVVGASLSAIFTAALYRYAETGEVPAAYRPELITGAFQAKTKRRLFS